MWQRAVTQFFYSLGVGFGSLIAFSSHAAKDDDYIGNAVKVSAINCATSVLAGFVVFPLLGYLAFVMRTVNPCIEGSSVRTCRLTRVGSLFTNSAQEQLMKLMWLLCAPVGIR